MSVCTTVSPERISTLTVRGVARCLAGCAGERGRVVGRRRRSRARVSVTAGRDLVLRAADALVRGALLEVEVVEEDRGVEDVVTLVEDREVERMRARA